MYKKEIKELKKTIKLVKKNIANEQVRLRIMKSRLEKLAI